MDKREDQVLREWSHVTQGLTTDAARNRLVTVTGQPKAQPPADATPEERAIHATVKRTTQRGKRELQVSGAQVAGKPYIPRQTGGGYMVSGQEPTGARIEGFLFRRPKAKAKQRGGAGAGVDVD